MTVPSSRLPAAARRAFARFVAGVVLVLSQAASRGGGEAGPIPWRRDYDRAVAEARASDRPLWLQFSGKWCTFCRRMEAEVFTRPEVAERARTAFVPVWIDSEASEELVERFGVQALPTTVLASPQGTVLFRNEGFAEPREFVAFLDSVRDAAVKDDVALAGYCPVSLVEGRGLQPGERRLTARHDGRVYQFADGPRRELFLRHPERYVPSNGGRCAVRLIERGEAIAGDPHCGIYYRGRLYLCADEDARRQFARAPERYVDADLAEQGYCPHCRLVGNRRVRGLPQYSTTHGGRRYLFPDRLHLDAFQASPERYLR